jgi:hypothetical protein
LAALPYRPYLGGAVGLRAFGPNPTYDIYRLYPYTNTLKNNEISGT